MKKKKFKLCFFFTQFSLILMLKLYKEISECDMVQFAHINFNNRNFHKNHIFVHTIFTALLNFLLIVRNCRYIYSGYKEISECSSSSEFLNEVSSWLILNEKRPIVVILNFCSSRVTVQLLASCKD